MVGQSKSSNKLKEVPDSIASAEFSYLKTKNQELAKALAQSKSEFTQVLAERDYLQRELLNANLQIKKLEGYIDVIEDSTKNTFNKIVACSSDVTKALQTIHFAKKITKNLENNLRDASDTSILQMSVDHKVSRESLPLLHNHSTSPVNSSKTQAVKPMVGGHVIFRPIISLRRVNEEEIGRSMNVGAQQATEHVTEDAVTQEPEEQQNSSFQCQTTSYVSSHLSSEDLSDQNISISREEAELFNTNESEGDREIENNRLQTLQEEEEISQPLNNSQLSNESNNSKDMMIGLFTGVKLFTYNSAQNASVRSKKISNSSCNGDGCSQIEEDAGTSGRVPMVTTNRGTRECIYTNLESSNLNSYSVENGSTVLSMAQCSNSKTVTQESLSVPSTSGLQFRKSSSPTDVISEVENSLENSSNLIGTKSLKTYFPNGTLMNSPMILLENLDATEINKLQQLSILGLEPKYLKDNTSTPISPSIKINRRHKNAETAKASLSPDTSLKKSPRTPCSTSSASIESTPQKKTSRQNTMSSKNKKQIILGNPSVILKRLTIKRTSRSPVKTRGSKTSKRTSNKDLLNGGTSSEMSARSTKRSNDDTRGKQRNGSREQTPKKRKLSTKRSMKGEIPLLSPQKLSDSPIRPRRRLPLKSFKEPNLVKKMRRSK